MYPEQLYSVARGRMRDAERQAAAARLARRVRAESVCASCGRPKPVRAPKHHPRPVTI